jgi:hypothetical protein
MDFQGTAGKEVTALQTRQQYLGTLAEQKRCGEAPPAGSTAGWAGLGAFGVHCVFADRDHYSNHTRHIGKSASARTG